MTETVDCLERLGLVTRADLVTYRQLYPEDYGGGRLLHLAGGSAHG